MSGSATPADLAAPGSTRGKSPLRLDIEGLRAVAILAVLVYHAGISVLPGGFAGVDIFFVISGFLITSLLVREAQKTGRISLATFYARRAKRLLPAATVVLVASAAGTALLFSGSEARAFGGDIAAAAANLVNWRFAQRSVDYLAEDTGQSPVLHFWSLAVEEQFYIVWPFLVLVALLIARRLRRSILATMALGLGVIGVASFIASVVLSQSDPARSFFVTTTRMWELAVGAAIALAAPLCARLAPRVAGLIAGLGAAAILASLVLLNDGMTWPGAAALLPVLGTAAVIAAGVGTRDSWPARLLSIKPMVWIGGLSYSLYLWHWPLLVFAEQYRGYLGVRGAVLVSLAAFVPAYLSQRLVENPIRFSRKAFADRGRVLLLGALLIALGLSAGLAVVASNAQSEAAVSIGDGPGEVAGALALGADPTSSPAGAPGVTSGTIVPEPASAPDDVPSAYERGCQASASATRPKYCTGGDPDGDIRILAVGDSKLLQYYDVLDAIGRERGWSIEFAAKSACSWIDGTPLIDGRPYTECAEFGDAVSARLADSPPDVLLTSGGRFNLAGQDSTDDGDRARALEGKWREATEQGVAPVVLLDNPHPPGGTAIYECVAEHADNLEQCSFPRPQAVNDSLAPAQLLASDALGSVGVVDLTDYLCPQDRCAPVIGDVLIYRQGSHITNTYALSLQDVLGERLSAVIDRSQDSSEAGVTDE